MPGAGYVVGPLEASVCVVATATDAVGVLEADVVAATEDVAEPPVSACAEVLKEAAKVWLVLCAGSFGSLGKFREPSAASMVSRLGRYAQARVRRGNARL